jgi:hypothetical protein
MRTTEATTAEARHCCLLRPSLATKSLLLTSRPAAALTPHLWRVHALEALQILPAVEGAHVVKGARHRRVHLQQQQQQSWDMNSRDLQLRCYANICQQKRQHLAQQQHEQEQKSTYSQVQNAALVCKCMPTTAAAAAAPALVWPSP